MMNSLIDYIVKHTDRGECQCGKCCDKGQERAAPIHSVNVHFFWVSAVNDPSKEEFEDLLATHYPDPQKLKEGPSFINIDCELGSQELALRFLGLGELLNCWQVITPERLGIEGELASRLAGQGMVMLREVHR